MIKIIVDSEEIKQTLLDESEYIHDFSMISETFKNNLLELNPHKIEILRKIYIHPDIIEVDRELCKN